MTTSLVCLSGSVRPSSGRHRYECQLRRADLHGDGTVGNVFYVDYLQEARLDLLRHHDTSPTPNPGEGLVVVRTVVEYLTPLRYADAPLTVDTWVSNLRAASFTLGYELSTRTGVHARATTTLAAYVFASERPRRLSAEEKERLEGNRDAPPFEDVRTPPAAWSSGTVHRRPIHVRFSDVDLLGHVNNVRYFDYVHEASVEVVMGVFQEARVSGTVDTVVVRSEMDHLAQMNLRPEPYDVWSRVSAIGRTSLTLDSEIRDGDRVMARSRIVEVNVDADGRPLPWHEKHRELFEQRIGSGAGPHLRERPRVGRQHHLGE
jgi:acyl-CoA thioester hydrolase